jgi:hypothetical protein
MPGTDQEGIMETNATPAWSTMVSRAAELGKVHGQANAAWYEIPTMADAVWVIFALEHIDPLVCHTFDTPPAGDNEDEYSLFELLRELGADANDGELWDVYTDAWQQAYEEEVSRYAYSFI